MSIDLKQQYDKIYRYCWLRVHNRETAEDLTQETFLRYLEKPQYHGTNHSLQLLYTIAGNLCKDHYKKKTEADISEYEDILEATGTGSSLESEAADRITLSQALEALSQEDRELLLLRYVNEVPVNVISRILGISRFAVYRRINAVLKQIREILGEEGDI